jgi:hypothetical protein
MYITEQYIPVPSAATAVTNIYKNFHKDGMNFDPARALNRLRARVDHP